MSFWGVYRDNLSLHERYRLPLFCFLVSQNIRQPFRFVQRFAFAKLHPIATPHRKSAEQYAQHFFFFRAAIGNRTRIEGSTNLSVNRYTIAAIYKGDTPLVGIVITIFHSKVESAVLQEKCCTMEVYGSGVIACCSLLSFLPRRWTGLLSCTSFPIVRSPAGGVPLTRSLPRDRIVHACK